MSSYIMTSAGMVTNPNVTTSIHRIEVKRTHILLFIHSSFINVIETTESATFSHEHFQKWRVRAPLI